MSDNQIYSSTSNTPPAEPLSDERVRAFRSKPSEVEAIQWDDHNFPECVRFGEGKVAFIPRPKDTDPVQEPMRLFEGKDGAQGWVSVPVGHWVVRPPGDTSDMWTVDPDYFAAKYEPLADAPPEPLSDAELDALLAQCTPGPWGVSPYGPAADARLIALAPFLAAALQAERRRNEELREALDKRNAFLREVEEDNDAEPWDQEDELRRLVLAHMAVQDGDLLTAAALLYGTQPAIAREFLRRKDTAAEPGGADDGG